MEEILNTFCAGDIVRVNPETPSIHCGDAFAYVPYEDMLSANATVVKVSEDRIEGTLIGLEFDLKDKRTVLHSCVDNYVGHGREGYCWWLRPECCIPVLADEMTESEEDITMLL